MAHKEKALGGDAALLHQFLVGSLFLLVGFGFYAIVGLRIGGQCVGFLFHFGNAVVHQITYVLCLRT